MEIDLEKFSISEVLNLPFFFIIGRPRSGTTLLQTLCDAHPNIQIPPEARIIKESFYRFGQVKSWNEKRLNELFDFIRLNPKFIEWKVDENKVKSFLMKHLEVLNLKTILKVIYLAYPSVYHKKSILILGDKNPNYSRMPEDFLEYFPEAKIIHVVRDYRDHILSMKRVKLLKGNLPLIATIWRNSQEKIFSLQLRYPERIFSYKYEDFVGNPEHYLKEMCDFLKIEYKPQMLLYSGLREQSREGNKFIANDMFHGNLFKPITSDNVNKWKEKMRDRDIRRADVFVGTWAERSGYERVFRTHGIGNFFRVLPGYLYVYAYHLMNFFIFLVPPKYRRKIRYYFN